MAAGLKVAPRVTITAATRTRSVTARFKLYRLLVDIQMGQMKGDVQHAHGSCCHLGRASQSRDDELRASKICQPVNLDIVMTTYIPAGPAVAAAARAGTVTTSLEL